MANAHQRGQLTNDTLKKDLKPDGKIKSITLNNKALNIIWGGSSTKDRYWKKSVEDPEAMELVGVYWLEVSGRIPLKDFDPSTQYKLYFKIKLNDNAAGWDTYAVNFKLRLPGQRSTPVPIKMSQFKGLGWKYVPEEGLPFTPGANNSSQYSALSFAMYEIECEDFKTGLQIREVKIVPATENP